MKQKCKFKLNNLFARRVAIITLAYILFMTVIWGTIARQFPSGIQPAWLLWLIIGLSVGLYIAVIVIVEVLNIRRGS